MALADGDFEPLKQEPHPVGTLIYYLRENRVHSAPIITSQVVACQPNAERTACTPEQKDFYLAFGAPGITYRTCHGLVSHGEAYLSKEALAGALIDG